jgi:TP901-1 family phage major tail protein
MAAQTGRTALVKLDNTGGGSYQTVGGVRTRSLKINSELVDVTNSDSTNQWREALATAGVKSVEIAVSGIFIDDTYINQVIAYVNACTIRNWQWVHSAVGTFQGAFQVTDFELGAEYNGSVTFSFTLQSAGEVAFTGS